MAADAGSRDRTEIDHSAEIEDRVGAGIDYHAVSDAEYCAADIVGHIRAAGRQRDAVAGGAGSGNRAGIDHRPGIENRAGGGTEPDAGENTGNQATRRIGDMPAAGIEVDAGTVGTTRSEHRPGINDGAGRRTNCNRAAAAADRAGIGDGAGTGIAVHAVAGAADDAAGSVVDIPAAGI